MARTRMKILGIDIGTSSVKGAIIDSSGRLLEWGREGLLSNKPGELRLWDPRSWDHAVCRLIRRFRSIGHVDAVAISGNGPSLVPLSGDGEPTAPALLWLDDRQLKDPNLPSFYLPKVAWFRENNPDAYERTCVYLPCPEYLIYRLTGEMTAISPSAGFDRYLWDDHQIGAYGLEADRFPPVVRVAEKVGTVRHDGSVLCGPPGGVPVYAAGSDFLMCLLGTGTVVPGTTCDRAGTSEGINHCSKTAVRSESLRTLPHVVDGLYNVAGILSSTGRIFEWFRRVSGQEQKSYDLMLSEIEALDHNRSRPLFLPSLHVGATWEFSGAAFMDLDPEHGTAEMGRAVVESIGFSIRSLLETLAENGCGVAELRVSGGQARNAVWNQMKANLTGVPVAVPKIIDAELLGNVCCTLVGSGEYANLETASQAMVRFQRVYHPNQTESRRFTDAYMRFRETMSRVLSLGLDRTKGAQQV